MSTQSDSAPDVAALEKALLARTREVVGKKVSVSRSKKDPQRFRIANPVGTLAYCHATKRGIRVAAVVDRNEKMPTIKGVARKKTRAVVRLDSEQAVEPAAEAMKYVAEKIERRRGERKAAKKVQSSAAKPAETVAG